MLLNITIKEHDEFGVAFKLYFLHSSTIIGSTCVRVWIQEGWIEWLAHHKNIRLGKTNGSTCQPAIFLPKSPCLGTKVQQLLSRLHIISLRQLGQFVVGGGGVVGVVGLLTVMGRGKVKHRESPGPTCEVGISAFFDRQFSMLPR